MSENINGLAGRQLLPVPAGYKAALETFALQCNTYGSGIHVECHACFKKTYRRTPGSACTSCCEHASLTRGFMRKASGEVQPQTMCNLCGRRTNILTSDRAPIMDICVRDNMIETRPGQELCARCGAAGTEHHHWAPRAIFNDADEWPTSWLCPTHHRQWHAAMRAAAGRALPADQRIGENPYRESIWRIHAATTAATQGEA